MSFANRSVMDRVLHAPPPEGARVTLVFYWWCQSVAIHHQHLCSHLVGGCRAADYWLFLQGFQGSAKLSRRYRSLSFTVVTWTMHPDLILTEVGCVVPEPEEPSMAGHRPRFLRPSEIIHSKQDMLQFPVFIKVLEVHDFTLPNHSSDKGVVQAVIQ
jgi:hypothetical protein